MNGDITYMIYHPSKALIWNSFHHDFDVGYWSADDAFVVEFGNTDEEYEQAKALAEKVGGEVEEVRK